MLRKYGKALYWFGSVDDMICIPPHGVQKCPGYLWDRRETDYNPRGVCGGRRADMPKALGQAPTAALRK